MAQEQLSSLIISSVNHQRKKAATRSEASREKPRFRQAHVGCVHVHCCPEGKSCCLRGGPIPGPTVGLSARSGDSPQASPRSAWIALCSDSQPARQQPPGELAPRREEDWGGDKSTVSVERGTAWCPSLQCWEEASILSDMVRDSLSDLSGVLRRVNVRKGRWGPDSWLGSDTWQNFWPSGFSLWHKIHPNPFLPVVLSYAIPLL